MAVRNLEPGVLASSRQYAYAASRLAQDGLLYPICVGNYAYAPGYDLRRNSFDSYLINVVTDGEMHVECDAGTFCARKGDAVILDCHKPHRYGSPVGWKALWVHFDGLSAGAYYRLILRQAAPCQPSPPAVRQALEALYGMFSRGKTLSEPQMALHLTAALTALTQPVAAPKGYDLSITLSRISHSLGHEPSVRQLAAEAALSEYHFIRVFRQMMGLTPRQYIIAARMNHARYLLATTGMSVLEIAQAVGYASESMFCAVFKRTQGMTPSGCRREQPAETRRQTQ